MVEAAPGVAAGGRSGQLCRERGKAGRRAASETGRPGQPGRRSSPAACRDSRSWPRNPPGASRPTTSGRLELADWLTQPGSPADRPRDGQPDLAVPLRPGDRGDPVQLRHPGRAAQLTPSCSTGSPRNSSRAAGRSRACIARSCFPKPTSSRAKPTRASAVPRPRRPLALAVSARAAGRRVDPRRDAGRLGQARTTPAGPASVPADRSLALDPAQPVQGCLSHPRIAAST